MRIKFLFLFLLLSLRFANGDEASSTADSKVLKLMGSCFDSDLSIVGSDRDAVISRLREIASAETDDVGNTSIKRDDAKVVLMRLGDVQTIQVLVSRYQKLDSNYSIIKIPALLDWSCQPLAISYLAPDFFLNEDPAKNSKLQGNAGSVDIPPRSIYSCIITLEIIDRSLEFNKATKAWGRDIKRLVLKDPAKFRSLMQIWWKENQQAFQQRNYSAVLPRDDESLNFLPSKKPAFVLPLLYSYSPDNPAKESVIAKLTKILGDPDEIRSDSFNSDYQYILDDGTAVVASFLSEKLIKISIAIPGQKIQLLYPR